MNNVALITGASAGIGEALARLHAERGGDSILVARRAERLEALKQEIEGQYGTHVMVLPADLSDETSPQRIYDAVKAAGVELSILINNAGLASYGKFHEVEWERQRAIIQVDVISLTALTYLFLPDMVARGSGRIMNVASTAALVPGPFQSVYFASKAFVKSLSEAVDEEVRDTGVTVTTLIAGATESEFASISGMDKTDLYDAPTPAAEVAKKSYDAMMAGKLSVYAAVPATRQFIFNFISLLPRRFLLKQARKTQEVKGG